jgi:hypothetical protein
MRAVKSICSSSSAAIRFTTRPPISISPTRSRIQQGSPSACYLGLYQNETSQFCHWNINATHYLEAWSDARAYDGTVSIIQPLIAPLYNGKSAARIRRAAHGRADATGYDIVRAYWQKQHTGADFEAVLAQTLNDGLDRRLDLCAEVG